MRRSVLTVVFLLTVGYVWADSRPKGEESRRSDQKRVMKPYTTVHGLENVDFSRHEIDLGRLYAGCPARDCIPALTSPAMEPVADADIPAGIMGILVTLDGESRYYPYNILVWHEIVNDQIGDAVFAVTYCPLCGSGMVMNRRVGERTLTFGVSGTLFESNLMMYDDSTFTLRSQAGGRAVVGMLTGTELELLPMQLLTVEEVRERYPSALAMSRSTGHDRDYSRYPYGDYEKNDRILFPVSKVDDRFPLKELFFVFRAGNKSVAFRQESFSGGKVTRNIGGLAISISRSGGEITAEASGQQLPGYYEMWFSWVLHHQSDGAVWEQRP